MIKVRSFPTLSVAGQLFYVPGQAVDGGFTSGGVRVLSPEPGGRGFLDLQLALQINEWSHPAVSWLMSKTNGEVFRYRLAPTPQCVGPLTLATLWDNSKPWNNSQPWAGDALTAQYVQNVSEGNNVVYVALPGLNQALKYGHVIGHGDYTYMIDDIEYTGDVAKITVMPPLRRDVKAGDVTLLRPYFTGSITNGADFRNMYEAENRGAIKPGKITLMEAVVP